MHCGSCSHERIQYGIVFPEAGNLNGSNADLWSNVAGPSRSGSGDFLELSDGSNKTIILLFFTLQALLAAILSVTTTPILPSGRVTSSCVRSINESDVNMTTKTVSNSVAKCWEVI